MKLIFDKASLSFFLLFLLFSSSFLFSQNNTNVSISGKITDKTDNSPLIGATIFVQGTLKGASSDIQGKYKIANLPAGDLIVICRYIGYVGDTIPVKTGANEEIVLNLSMKPDVLIGKEMVITAQMQGQQSAINQQITSNRIVNVVSKDKIQELPDNNAAESISRLPGVSIQRDGGEGSKVVIRGLEPKFNGIMIDGQKIPATDAENRSVDLSMISSDILAGMEVIKAITPDQDGDAIGGVVNFEVKKADEGYKADIKALGGYNDLGNYYGNFRTTATVSNRFVENALGVIVSGNWQQANRGSDNLNASYSKIGTIPGSSIPNIKVGSLNFIDKAEIRSRYGANLVMDYVLEKNEFVFNSLYSRTDREEIRRRKGFSITGSSIVRYVARQSEINTDLLTLSMTGKHDLNIFRVRWQTAYLETKQRTPYFHESEFRELSAYTNETMVVEPDDAVRYAKNDTSDTIFYYDGFGSEQITDKDLTGQFDVTYPLVFGNAMSFDIKFGGKFRGKSRVLEGDTKYIEGSDFNSIMSDDSGMWRGGSVRKQFPNISNFYDYGYSYGEFLNGRYSLGPALPLSLEKLEAFKNRYISLYKPDYETDLKEYTADEKIYAGYLLSEINFGQPLMILPGLRVEHTVTHYAAKFSNNIIYDENGDEIASPGIDTLGTKTETNYLPMAHIRYRFTDISDIRFAYTNSISRPNFLELAPWERETSDGLERGTPDLKNSTVQSYDLFLSFYGKYGLFTLGGFYKNIKNIDYVRKSRAPSTMGTGGDVDLYKPENSPFDSKVYGMEVDLQSNFRLLPSPFDGIVLNLNFALITSKTNFPYQIVRSIRRPPSPVTYIQYVDTIRESRMPGQANSIANMTLGYEKNKFSGRLSLTYQGDALTYVGEFPEADGFSKEFLRWDFSSQYKIFSNFTIMMNVNNLSSLPEGSFVGFRSSPTKEEDYGWTMDVGVRYEFE